MNSSRLASDTERALAAVTKPTFKPGDRVLARWHTGGFVSGTLGRGADGCGFWFRADDGAEFVTQEIKPSADAEAKSSLGDTPGQCSERYPPIVRTGGLIPPTGANPDDVIRALSLTADERLNLLNLEIVKRAATVRALRKYGRHLRLCDALNGGACSCGYDAAMRECGE